MKPVKHVVLVRVNSNAGKAEVNDAFAELAAIGWLRSAKRPRMISCQSTGCAPIATAFERGERFATKFECAATIASGIRVPAAVGDFMILDAVRESGGVALATPEADIPKWMQLATAREGISLCPETAVCFDVLEQLIASGQVDKNEEVLVFNTGAAQKYLEALPAHLPCIEKEKGF